MRRRRNFWAKKRWAVRTYPYTKRHSRGDRNVDERRYAEGQRGEAIVYARAQIAAGYPEVEVVDLDTEEVLWRSISMGPAWESNRSRKRKRKRKTEVSRRDVFAEMAKARKTTRGHRRKERSRAVAKGHSRKAKHRRRFNPDDPYIAELPENRQRMIDQMRGFIQALRRAGVPPEDLPGPTSVGIGRAAQQAGEALTASGHAAHRDKARLDIGPTALARELLQLAPGGVFAPYYAEHKDLFEPAVKSLARAITSRRAKIKAVDKRTAESHARTREVVAEKARAKDERAAQSTAARIAELRRELGEDIPEDVAAELAEEFSDEEREEESAELREEEPLLVAPRPPERAPLRLVEEEYDAPRARPASSRSADERLGQYARHLADVRRTDVRPPLEAVAEAREDVLLYALADGTTQVWAKGALTETFLPDKKTSSLTIAHRYANRWRGLNARGRVREDAKRSRLRSRVLLTIEGQDGVRVIEPSIAQSIGQVTPKATVVHDLPDLDAYELKGDRANPRRRKNRLPGAAGAPPYYRVIRGLQYELYLWEPAERKAFLQKWKRDLDDKGHRTALVRDGDKWGLYWKAQRGRPERGIARSRARVANPRGGASYTRGDRNPYAKRYTLDSFSRRYWGKDYKDVSRRVRSDFWHDFNYGYTGGLGRYIRETTHLAAYTNPRRKR